MLEGILSERVTIAYSLYYRPYKGGFSFLLLVRSMVGSTGSCISLIICQDSLSLLLVKYDIWSSNIPYYCVQTFDEVDEGVPPRHFQDRQGILHFTISNNQSASPGIFWLIMVHRLGLTQLRFFWGGGYDVYFYWLRYLKILFVAIFLLFAIQV